MVKTSRVVYTLRGWMAFVAFIQIGTAIRCHVERDIYLGVKSYREGGEEMPVGFTFSRLYSVFNVLLALTIVQCALHIHYKTIRQMTLMALMVSVSFMLSELFYFKSVPALEVAPGIHICLQGVTLVWLWVSPRFFIPLPEDDDESTLNAGDKGKGGSSPFASEAVTNAQFRAHAAAAAKRRRRRVD